MPASTPAEVRRIKDPLRRAGAAVAAMDVLLAQVGELGAIRRQAVSEAVAGGMSRAAVARALGVSPQAITNLLNGH